MKKILFSAIAFVAISASSGALADAAKCSPCQAKKSAADALQQSIKEAAAAVLAAGGAFSREQELDSGNDAAKGCGCGGSKTRRDELDQIISDKQLTVAACCDFCAEPGSLGCQGVNSSRCNTCQQGLIKMSIAEAAADALAAIEALAQEAELDIVPADLSRAPREELGDPCDPCATTTTVCDVNLCDINQQLNALRCCCASVAQRLTCQAKDAKRCCRKLKHEIHEVEELVESVLDQSADCCSLIDSVLGDPLTSSAIDIPACVFAPDIVSVVDSTDADILTWLKSLYVLLFQVYQCACNPCAG